MTVDYSAQNLAGLMDYQTALSSAQYWGVKKVENLALMMAGYLVPSLVLLMADC